MRNITKFVLCAVAAGGLLFSTGCKSDCEKAYDHIVELAKKEKLPEAAMKEMSSEEGKKKGIEQCKNEEPEQVKCALEAGSLEDIGKCAAKAKKDEKK